jgi:phenylalanyl-tRNA synthetase beta chain
MRSISLIVDITNYVMLELGQPLHAYDLDKLQGGITVRRANPGESLTTLDGQVRKLDVEDLLICDESGPIGLAGVMGGQSTEVSLETRNVLIEAANFDPISIARSARRHKLPSEASKRFERGVDPQIGAAAVARVIQLLEVHAGGQADSLGAEFHAETALTPIWLPAEFATEHVGVLYTHDEIVETLSQIGCVVASVAEGFEVIPPSWRPDLRHKTDLVEEVARITGYDRIPSRIPVAPPGRGLTPRQRMRRSILNQLAGTGLVEVLNYPFLSTAENSWFAPADRERVTLANALQSDSAEMRVSLLPGLMAAAKRNLSRGITDLALLEEGSAFLPASNPVVAQLPSGTELPNQEVLDALNASIPDQPRHLAAVLLGNRVVQQVGVKAQAFDYSDAIHTAKVAAHAVGVELQVRQGTAKGFHPGRTAELFVTIAGEPVSVGFAGELDPSLTQEQDLPRNVAALELNLEKLYKAAPEVVQASHLLTMPAATQDLSLVVDANLAAAVLRDTIVEGAGELLESIRLVDDYRGEVLGTGRKSLTFALRFRAADRTLTQAEASEARDAAVALAASRHGAELRA